MPKSDVFIISFYHPSHIIKSCAISLSGEPLAILRPPHATHPGRSGPALGSGLGSRDLGIPLCLGPSSAHPLPVAVQWPTFPPPEPEVTLAQARPGQWWPRLARRGLRQGHHHPSPDPGPGTGSALSVLFITRTKREGLKTARSEPLPHIRFQVCDQEY